MTTAGGSPVGGPPAPRRSADDGVPLGVLAGLGAQFAVALVLFGYLGSWLDRRWQSAPWCLIVGVFFGGGGVFFTSYRRVMAQRSAPDVRSSHDASSESR
ncbi:MAG: AtpZ/AtpI family protein [Gemmatimonadaceae bacterium]|nr:AtpZ/AtpI family protein [Gemmatimonadaceae bacterium]